MMISPEGYYEQYLKGKDEKQIMTAIRGLKQEIGRLKNSMENPRYGVESIMCPSEATRLWCNRLYLERAKAALSEVGVTYKPSKAELRVASFDSSIPAINKVAFSIGGYFGGYETRTISLDNEHIYFNDGCDYTCTKEELIDGIKGLHLGEWRTHYTNKDVLDGTQWELTIEFSNGHKPFKTYGSNAYPYNFDALQELLGIDAGEKCDD